jgi:hypothetical protein
LQLSGKYQAAVKGHCSLERNVFSLLLSIRLAAARGTLTPCFFTAAKYFPASFKRQLERDVFFLPLCCHKPAA